jgi:3-oxoacyl-[acyl-carrier protein] reductase
MAQHNGRVALIAGGSGEIGRAVALRLAADGIAAYIGFEKRAEDAASVAEEIRRRGGWAEAIHLDLLQPEQPDDVCQMIFDRQGRLDILVNCAGINRESPAAGMDDATWREVMDINLDGAFRICRAAAKFMMLAGSGRIINMSSIAAVYGGRGQINYAASKAGVEAMTRVLASELGRKGILVNCISPGVIETGMSERIRREHGDSLMQQIALRRYGKPEEVAEVAAFLVSASANYVIGQVLKVDGGMGL